MTLWGQAKIEILVIQDEIKSELRRGIPMKRIYNALVDAKHITVSYNSFRRQIIAFRQEINDIANSNIADPINNINPETTPVSSKPKTSFKFKKMANDKDYI